MLKVMADESAIRRYQRQFVRSLKTAAAEAIPVKLGHPGASEKAKVAWSESLGIWFFSRKLPGSRYWNGFGIGRPEGGGNVAITCEINFPLYGIDRRTGGAYAQDHAGRVFVVHRGKLGGGRKGIGKSLFENHYRGAWEIMDDDGEETMVAVIGVLQSPRFARQIAQFVHKIARIKEAAATPSPQTELSFDELCVREDLIGDRYCEPKGAIGAECDHGLIVRDLAEVLKKSGLRTGNDGQRDLLIMDQKDRIRAAFQVLTEMTLPVLHAGVTQLLLNGLSLPAVPLLILALPGEPENALRDKLKRMNIDLLIYQWAADRAVFRDLDALMARIMIRDRLGNGRHGKTTETNTMDSLANIKHLILDMDGVLYRGKEPMPRLQEFFAFLRKEHIKFILMTNNATRTPQQRTDQLASMGAQVSPAEIMVSGQAVARYLRRDYPAGTRVHVFGMPALRQALMEEGFVIADDDVKVVVASVDREVTFEKIKIACRLILGGARFLATNFDPNIPSEDGLLPGSGAMVAMLAAASGVTPTGVGKPEPIMYELAMTQMDARPETTAAVGDRVMTDIVGGKRAGLTTICVLSGASDRAEAEAAGTDFIFDDIGRLLDAWRAALAGINPA